MVVLEMPVSFPNYSSIASTFFSSLQPCITLVLLNIMMLMSSTLRSTTVCSTSTARRLFSTIDKRTIEQQEKLLFPRTLEIVNSEKIDDWNDTLLTSEQLEHHGNTWRANQGVPREHGFNYRGHEPTMFGDWQHKGRTTDF